MKNFILTLLIFTFSFSIFAFETSTPNVLKNDTVLTNEIESTEDDCFTACAQVWLDTTYNVITGVQTDYYITVCSTYCF